LTQKIITILKLLLYTGIFSTLLPLIFFLLFKRNNKEKELKVILFYILYCIVNEGLSFYFQITRSTNTTILFALYNIVEFSFLGYFFYLIFRKQIEKKITFYIGISYILFASIDFIYFNKWKAFDSFASGIESIIIILLCIYFLFSQIKGSNSLLIYSTFNFWVVITFLIYFSGTFFLYLIADSMRENVYFQKLYFIINISFNILKNILLCVAMTMKINHTIDKQPTPSLPELDDDIFFYNNKN
jgi:hypothetical protein